MASDAWPISFIHVPVLFEFNRQTAFQIGVCWQHFSGQAHSPVCNIVWCPEHFLGVPIPLFRIAIILVWFIMVHHDFSTVEQHWKRTACRKCHSKSPKCWMEPTEAGTRAFSPWAGQTSRIWWARDWAWPIWILHHEPLGKRGAGQLRLCSCRWTLCSDSCSAEKFGHRHRRGSFHTTCYYIFSCCALFSNIHWLDNTYRF